VDPQSRNHLFETVRHLHSEGKTVLYTTHYMEEVESLCERVAIMDRGALIAENSLEQLLGGKESLEEVFLDLTGRGLRDAE
jgi:ABC-2 type transport system ATP-binding protein